MPLKLSYSQHHFWQHENQNLSPLTKGEEETYRYYLVLKKMLHYIEIQQCPDRKKSHPSLVNVKASTTMVSAKKIMAHANNHRPLLGPLFWVSWPPSSTSLRSSVTLSMSESLAAWSSLLWILSSLLSRLLLDASLSGQIKPVIFQRRMPTYIATMQSTE